MSKGKAEEQSDERGAADDENPAQASQSNDTGKPVRGRPFEKGRSGNPRGRPRKKPLPAAAGIMKALAVEMAKPITFDQNGKKVKMTGDQLSARQLMADCLGKDAKARRIALEYMRKAGYDRIAQEYHEAMAVPEAEAHSGWDEELEREFRLIEREFAGELDAEADHRRPPD